MHPSDDRIEGYARRTLGPAEILAVDDHLAACDACRSRAASLAGYAAGDLAATLLPPETHLSDAQVGEFVGGGLSAGVSASVQAHLRDCSTCAREVEELSAWAAKRRRPLPRGLYVAAAAAVLIMLLIPVAARWRSLSSTGQADQPGLAGMQALPDEQQRRVRAALRAGVAEPPADFAELAGGSDALMGDASGESFRLIEPLGTVTVSDRPTFRWEPLAGATSYTVSVSDEGLRPVLEGSSVSQTSWTSEQPLPRGRVYVWQVTARRATGAVTAPVPPAPMAKFRVLEEQTARLLERVAREHPASHLLLGILYAQAGVRAEATGHLERVRGSDPRFETARRTLEKLSTRR